MYKTELHASLKEPDNNSEKLTLIRTSLPQHQYCSSRLCCLCEFYFFLFIGFSPFHEIWTSFTYLTLATKGPFRNWQHLLWLQNRGKYLYTYVHFSRQDTSSWNIIYIAFEGLLKIKQKPILLGNKKKKKKGGLIWGILTTNANKQQKFHEPVDIETINFY